MATPKRKYSFGLVSRLTLIAAFVGLGSWAVFNSKFKEKEPQQVAENDEESNDGSSADTKDGTDSQESDENQNKESSNNNLDVNADSKTQPASFIEQSKPSKIKKQDTNKNKPGSSSAAFGSSTKKSPPASKSFTSGSFGTKSGGGFAPPSSNFSPSTSSSSSGSGTKSQFGKSGQDTKSGPPISTFNPSASVSPASSKKAASEKKGTSKKKSTSKTGPPSSSFTLDSKSTPIKPSSTFSPSGSGFAVPGKSAASTEKSGGSKKKSSGRPPSTFNPSSGGLAKSESGGPPKSTFDPRGSFQQPGSASKSKSIGDDSSKGFSSSGFQAKSSDGNERPLRGGGSGFSLSSDNRKKGTANPVGNPGTGNSGTGNSGTGTSGISNPNRSSFGGITKSGSSIPGVSGSGSGSGGVSPSQPRATFSGGNAFQDKGSQPLRGNNASKSNDLVKSKGSSGLGSSSTGFADIGNRDKQDKKTGGTSLDPRNLNPGSRNNPGTRNNPGSRDRPGTVSNPGFGGPTGNQLSGQGDRSQGGRSQSGSTGRSGFASQGTLATDPMKFSSNPNLGGVPQSGVNDRKPGPSSLEGIQAPAVTLQKVSPREIQVNVEASFNLILRNVGRSSAANIMVVDPIPEGTQFVTANPAPTERATDGSLIWKFGSLAPGQQKVITVKLLPKRQGEIGSVARMSFQSAATAKSVCTKPEISVTHTGPRKILMGQSARFVVTVQNNGDGVAKNVVIEDEVPPGFAFGSGKGSRLAYEVGNLAPGAKREVQLNLRAIEPGRYVNEIRAKMGQTTAANHKLDVEVVSPKLKMEVVGPTRRYIQREAKYKIEVQNTGTASAKNVLMVTRLPKGMKYVRTNNRGQYNPREHAVYWSMVELSPQNKGGVELVLMPVGTGQQEIEFEARSLLDRTDLKKFPVIVDQLAELFFEVDDRDDPIEVNGETEYRSSSGKPGLKSGDQCESSTSKCPKESRRPIHKDPAKGL